MVYYFQIQNLLKNGDETSIFAKANFPKNLLGG